MTTYEAVGKAEGWLPTSGEGRLAAWQHLIDTGICWELQGSFGRVARQLIEEGVCQPAANKVEKV